MTSFRERPGIRVVRLLERDAHLETLLVRVDGDEPRPAVLARALDVLGARARRRELAALDRGRGPGVTPVIDVVEDDIGAATLLARVPGTGLARLLAERESWQAGEAVGVLLPLVETLARLHDVGVAHGRVAASDITVGEEGPVLGGFLQAELFAAHAPEVVRERVDGVARDRAAIRELAVHVLARVAGARMPAARELTAAIAAVPASEVMDALERGLRDLAAAVPVALLEPSAAPSPSVGGAQRIVPVAREVSAPDAGRRAPRPLERVRALVGTARARLDALSAARRRTAVGGGAALAVAALLLAVLPPSPAPHVPGGASAVADAPTAAPSSEASGAASASGVRTGAISGDDPLAAVGALLARREECLAELSLLCLEEVDQAGSAALADDRRGVEALRGGGEAALPAVDPVSPQLVERLGDSALVRLGPETAPASLLIVRGEAGWRIRDWVASD
ncbi:MAG: hypothetical protein QM598_00325 [Protaetiibacter sp.]